MKQTLALLLAVTLLAGCDTVKAPYAIASDQVPPGQYPRNVSVSGDLSSALVAGQTIVHDASKDQPMSISQPMRNVRDSDLKVQYQFVFLDSSGQPVSGSGGWTYLTLEPRVQRFLQGAALDTSAVDWRLTIRPAQ
jgi:uncharacterized protein YcfL